MDDIGNLVYVLVLIIWVLYKVFGKSGKKPVRPMPPFDQTATPTEPTGDIPTKSPSRESTSPPLTFEDMLRELTGAPPVTVTPEPEPYEDRWDDEELQDQEEETSFEMLETPAESPAQIGYDSGKFKEFEIQQDYSSQSARNALKMFRSKQGVKQAFIMKEIFDRRY